MTRITRIVLAVLLAAVVAAPAAHARDPFTLDAVRAKVREKYSGVPQISPDTLAERLKPGGDMLLFDVREPGEYAVSHLAGAERVDPGTWRSTFLEKFGDKARGKTVVFYCAVGERSSRLMQSVQEGLKERGAAAVYNLDGGVFGWHNGKHPLVNAKGATDYVHPFDARWGKLLERGELARTEP